MKNYQVVFSATIDAKQLQAEADKIAGKTKMNFNAKGITDFGNAAKSSGGMLGEFTNQLTNLGSTIPKVAAFGVATAAIGAFTAAASDAVSQVFELDSAITEFRKVSELSGEGLEEYTDKLANLGSEVARTRSEMIQASTEFVKSGYSEEDSAILAQMAAMYQNIADEEISAGDSASFIIAQMKAFNIEAQDSVHIIDAVNEVANNYAVSSADLANNLGKVSSTLAVTGTSFEEALGMLTGITEITRNASTASRGLKQISSRLTQTLDESSSTGQKLKDIYSGLGIALLDGEGQIRSTYDILKDLSEVWNTLSTNEQEYIALTSAGSNQVQNFTALMSNFGHVVDATATAENSAGSAARENATYMESLEAKLQGLKAAWQELVTEGGTINKFIKLLLDAGTAVLKFADSDIVKFIVKTAAFTAGLYAATKAVGALGVALWSLALNNPVGLFLGLTTGVAALALQLEKTHDPIYKAEQDINNLKIRIQETNDTISQLEAAGADDSILAMYRAQAADLNKELEEAEQHLFHVKNADFKVASGATEPEDMGAGIGGYKINWESTNRVEESIKSYEDAAKAVKRYEDQLRAGEDVEEDYTKSLNTQAEARQNLIDIYSEFKDNEENLTEEEEKQYEELKNQLEALGYLGEGYENLSELVETFGSSAANTINNQLASSIKILSAAIDEQNNKGVVAASTYNNLIKLFPELANQVTKVGNSYKFTDGALQQYINDHYKEISAMDAARVAAINYINQHSNKQVAINTTTKALKQEIAAMLKEAEADLASAQAKVNAEMQKIKAAHAQDEVPVQSAILSQYMSDIGYGDILQNINQLRNIYNSLDTSLQTSTASTAANTGATSSNTSAKDKASDAERKLKEEISKTTDALKDQTNAIKNAADYMVGKIDEQIDGLKDNKDAVNDYYDAWIERIRDANDELEDQIELEEALQALAEAKSKKIKVYKDGQFVYAQDTQGVAEAERRVSSLQRQREQEDLINQIEKARERDLASIDKQIEAWEVEKKAWKDASDSYDDYLAKQTLGIDKEGKNWSKRLGQAATYASDYLKLMQAIEDVESGKITPASGNKIISTVSSQISGLGESKSSLRSQVNTQSPISSYSPSKDVIVRTPSEGGTIINVDNISLPSVTDANKFVAELQNLAQYASQDVTKR